MSHNAAGGAWRAAVCAFVLALLGLATARPAHAASNFPDVPVWSLAGQWQDSSRFFPNRCIGVFQGPGPDSLGIEDRTITLRFLRDRVAEARPDFGGYRIYRMTNAPDSSKALLIRRFSRNTGSELTWNFSVLDTATMQYKCRGATVHDSIVTFVDPDSNGQYVKVCRRPGRPNQCDSPGDSIFILIAPPGPHDGFMTWYSITYERRNTTDPDYEDLFLPDTLDNFARCPGAVRDSCPNLNHKLRNLAGPTEPTGGPTPNLEQVMVVPNPYRGSEVWDQPGQSELHFINLPGRATIKIYTAAGDLVRQLEHTDTVRDFARWDLKNASGQDVTSGIYVYRVEAGSFQFQHRFVVIR
jgi:hypothetical protein